METSPGLIRLTGRLVCRSLGEVAIVRAHLPEHTRLTRLEPGCVSFQVLPSDDPLVWQVSECFVDRQAFEHHQRRTRASAWWQATAAIPRDYEISGLD